MNNFEGLSCITSFLNVKSLSGIVHMRAHSFALRFDLHVNRLLLCNAALLLDYLLSGDHSSEAKAYKMYGEKERKVYLSLADVLRICDKNNCE